MKNSTLLDTYRQIVSVQVSYESITGQFLVKVYKPHGKVIHWLTSFHDDRQSAEREASRLQSNM